MKTHIVDEDEQLGKRGRVMGYSFRPLGMGGGAADSSDPIGDALRASAVAYWKMDEASGTRVDSKADYDLTVFDAQDLGRNLTGVAGKVGNAVPFGQDVKVILRLADSADFRSTNSQVMYYAVWVKKPNAVGDAVLIAKTQLEPYVYDVLLVLNNGASGVKLVTGGDPYPEIVKTIAIGFDTWAFIECYIDSASNEMGVAVNNSAFTTGTIGQTLTGGTGWLSLGSEGGDNSVGVFVSSQILDELLVMHRRPTAAERTYLYNSGAGRTLYP